MVDPTTYAFPEKFHDLVPSEEFRIPRIGKHYIPNPNFTLARVILPLIGPHHTTLDEAMP
jgi:hypothetical protein